MKKFLVLLTLVASVTITASMQAAGSSPVAKVDAADLREARACAILLKKMSESPEADTWRNRMRAWPCRQRSDLTRVATAEARR